MTDTTAGGTAPHTGSAPISWWLEDRPVGDLTSPTPQGRLEADVAVVGLGASGLTTVVAVAEAGLDVIGLDAGGVAAGAAGANGGFLLAGLADFHHDAVARHGRAAANSWWGQTVEEMDRLDNEEPTFVRCGSLRIAADEEEERDCLIHLAQMRRDGIDAAAYDGPEGRGLIVPGDGVFHPAARCRRLAERARSAGARLHAPARVVRIEGGLVHLEAPDEGDRPPGHHQVRARDVVVAVDGGLERVLPQLEGSVRTARLQMLATQALPPPLLQRPVYRRFGLDYFQQRPTGEVLLGGGRDVGGDAEWAAPAVPSGPVQGHLDQVLAALGLVDVGVTRRWAAHAAFTTDGLPLDWQALPGVHVIGGYSGHGNVIGTILARRVARRILARQV